MHRQVASGGRGGGGGVRADLGASHSPSVPEVGTSHRDQTEVGRSHDNKPKVLDKTPQVSKIQNYTRS